MARTTIAVEKETQERLAEFCGKLRSYDQAINDLLDIAEAKDGKADNGDK